MKRVLYVLITYGGFCAFMGLLLACGMVCEWLRDRADRRTCDRHRAAMACSWDRQYEEIQGLPERVA